MFTKNIIYLSFLIIYIGSTKPRNKDIVVVSTGIKHISPRSVGLQFYSVLNNTSDRDYFVELITDQCCINSDESLDCDSIEIIGECSQVVQKGNVKAFTMVAPVLDPLQRKGYCVIHMDSRPVDKRNKITRDVIKIDFDTDVDIKNDNLQKLIKLCNDRDLDPLNDCKPVNCDTYYNGKKPIFDKFKKRCNEAPKCDNDDSSIFDPVSNQCFDGESIDSKDIDFIKTTIKRENNGRKSKNVIIVETTSLFNDDVTESSTKNAKVMDDHNRDKKKECTKIIKYLISNKYTLFLMALVIIVQCFFIFTMFYCLSKKTCHDEVPLERKYFNYRQDVSVTTPLIKTSNMDTETTEFDYVSESNVDNRIKCYKACQKKVENDTKVSLSDDILSKCLTRRDWNARPKSETNAPDLDAPAIQDPEWNKKVSDYVNSVKVTEDKHTADKRDINVSSLNQSCSEKLIQCHDYNLRQTSRNFLSQKRAPTVSSTEKGAQACFSNDSVDDFLSERGMIFLAGDDFSKNSFASNSTTNSEMDRSSKTSKNIGQKLSYLIKRSRIFTTSDPGVSKSSNKSLELIHMSKASVFSSSSSGYKHNRAAKCPKESRSSLF